MKLSVIVPAYKQETTIKKDIESIENILRQIRYDYEIIVVVDGKVDKTFENTRKVKSKKIKVVGYKKNHGKGYAVRYGMARSSGDYIAFIDAGMELDPNGLSMALEHLEWYDADIIAGSKRHPASQVNYPPLRKVFSFGYQVLIFLLFGLKVRDTQAGLKIFRRKVLEKVLPRLLVKRYAFDVEMLAVANYLGFRRIFEAPVKLSYNFSDLTHAADWKNILNMLLDTAAVFYRLRILRFYDDQNKRRWRYDPELNFRVTIG